MSAKTFISVAALAAVTGFSASVASAQITIPTVSIGNPGNAADARVMYWDGTTGYGSVAYEYKIGTTEVTNAQYAAFLNAVAATDTNNLYTTNMAGAYGGITRSGSSGSYTYSTISGRANNPVNFVSFWDATRFANWLHNGQPTGSQGVGTTEDGAYSLTAGAISSNSVTRKAGARWAIPSENEWYKAAYHQPVSQGGDSDDYWLYPTSSNNEPTTEQANYNDPDSATVAVGSYAANYYGAFDMCGNVWEWNESIFWGSSRGFRGGCFGPFITDPRADRRFEIGAGMQDEVHGFRIVQIPGPSSVALLAIGGLAGTRRRRGGR